MFWDQLTPTDSRKAKTSRRKDGKRCFCVQRRWAKRTAGWEESFVSLPPLCACFVASEGKERWGVKRSKLVTHRHAVDWELNESEMWNILWWINTDTGRRKGKCIYILKPLRHFRISHPISFNSLNNRCNYLAHSDFQLFGMRDLLNLVSSNWQHMQKVKCSEKCNFFPSIAVLGNSATDRDVTMRCKKIF